MQQAGADSRRENARVEMKKTKSFCFLHWTICICVYLLLGLNNYLCVDFYTMHNGTY